MAILAYNLFQRNTNTVIANANIEPKYFNDINKAISPPSKFINHTPKGFNSSRRNILGYFIET